MFNEIGRAVRPAIVLLLAFTAVTGLLYPAVLTGIGQALFPAQANGSLITDGDRVVGSQLIAQGFAEARYFHPRPSAAGKGYDASASSASNLSPGSKDLRDAIAGRVADARKDGLTGGRVPPDLVTTSASGLDPDLSPEAAFAQVARVAKARGMSPDAVHKLVVDNVAGAPLGILGDAHVNVLMLNRQMDRISPNAGK